MEKSEITRRVKQAIREWAADEDAKVLLGDKLSDFQSGDLDSLRVRINAQFRGEPGFPISAKRWEALVLKIVRDVRDAVEKILKGNA